MAAAIKMDELLVTWLGSDNVYQNVLNLIETYRATASLASPPSSPTRRSPKTENEFEALDASLAMNKGSSSTKDGSLQPSDSEDILSHSPRTVTTPIPPFYRPAGTINSDGKKIPPIRNNSRKNKDTTLDTDQSWDGSFTSSDGAVPPPPPSDSTNSTPAISTTSKTIKSVSSQGSGKKSFIPIKDQVWTIFDELGNKVEVKNDQGGTDITKKTKSKEKIHLTMDNFVKITKDICSFPTFFNRPLYRRILFLWNTKNLSEEESMNLYKDFLSKLEKEEEESSSAENDDGSTEKSQSQATASSLTSLHKIFDNWEMLITHEIFRWFWKKEMEDFDLPERFFRLLKQPHCNYIGRHDFSPFIKELLRDHPGLEFLSSHAEFQEKYAVTVITRIFYSVNRCHSGRITERQIRRSDLLAAFQQVDEEEDINKVTRYFSYEHFYVLYCRFWELDHDRDYKITREDLLKYGDQCLSHMIVDRIFDAAPRPFVGDEQNNPVGETDGSEDMEKLDGDEGNEGHKDGTVAMKKKDTSRDYMTYEDFIFFMLSEEDKANEISIRYWFSCVDVDGDGQLNNNETRSFYALQQHRMQSLAHENIPFEDMLCQMIDMIKPQNNDHLIVEDFLQPECLQVSGSLFDALFNLNKYLQFEQRDPFQERQKREDEFETDWDRFACMDYNRLAMEEEAREEDAMEIDWVTVDDEDEDAEDYDLGIGGASEAPF